MDGYLGDRGGYEPVNKPALRKHWRAVLLAVAYMCPLLALWIVTDFPNSFGVTSARHGWVGALEDYYHSYLLLQRHTFWDVVTFLYMWGGAAGLVIYSIVDWRRPRQAANTPLGNAHSSSNSEAE